VTIRQTHIWFAARLAGGGSGEHFIAIGLYKIAAFQKILPAPLKVHNRQVCTRRPTFRAKKSINFWLMLFLGLDGALFVLRHEAFGQFYHLL
jgi:hypothetical protein